MEKIIKAAVERGASDLHIKAGDVFRARIDGRLVPLTKQALTPEQTRAIALRLIPNDEDRARIDALRDYDCSWGSQGIGRFRVNILRQRSSFMVVMRVIPFEVPSLEKLRLPPVLARVAEAEKGMVLVTGVTGAGKSSTMAALVNHINATQNRHIITLESPIEFLHRDVKSSVTQREIGVDTGDFTMGLRAAMRQDPDVILLGEMREPETIDTAMKAAETGHVLLSTLHTPDVLSTVVRFMAMFPPEEQGIVRTRLAESLHAVISQRLLPRRDGSGRVAAVEVMIATPAIRALILEGERISAIVDHMAEGREQYGSQTFDQHLADLVRSGEVSFEVAMANASRPSDFALLVQPSGNGTAPHAGAESVPEASGPPAEEPAGTALPPADDADGAAPPEGDAPAPVESATRYGYDDQGS